MKTLSQHISQMKILHPLNEFIQEKLIVKSSPIQNDVKQKAFEKFDKSKTLYIIRLTCNAKNNKEYVPSSFAFDVIYDNPFDGSCNYFKDPPKEFKDYSTGMEYHYQIFGKVLIDYHVNYDTIFKHYEMDLLGNLLYNKLCDDVSTGSTVLTLVFPDTLKQNFIKLVKDCYDAECAKQEFFLTAKQLFVDYLGIPLPGDITEVDICKPDIKYQLNQFKTQLLKVLRQIRKS